MKCLQKLFLAGVIILTMGSAAWPCNLPLDPKVVVIPEGQAFEKTSWGVGLGGSKGGPMVAVAVDEGTTVQFRAYVNVDGTDIDIFERVVVIDGRTMNLISLPTLQTVAEAKMKFAELVSRNMGGNFSDPRAISLGGGVKDMTITGTDGGGHFGAGISGTGDTDMSLVLPTTTTPPRPSGPDSEYRVVSGEYKRQGQFRFELISSTFEFDLTGIEDHRVFDGGRAGVGSFEFNVPTSDKSGNGAEQMYYAGIGKVDLTLAFSDIVWTWKEQKYTKDASGTFQPDGAPTSHESNLSGNIVRTSEGSSTGGHPGYFYVKVRDTSPSIYSRMVGNLQGPEGTTGDVITAPFSITLDMVDNNPFRPTQTALPVDFFYTLAVTDYLDGGYSTAGMGMDKLKFAEYKDKIIWKKLSGSATLASCKTYPGDLDTSSISATDISGIGKAPHGPLTNNISQWQVTFTVPEKMGFHYSIESNDTTVKGQGQLLDWENGRLKFFAVPTADGQGNAGPVCPGPTIDSEEAGAKDSIDPTYTDTRATFSDVTTGNPTEEFTGLTADEDITKVVGRIGFWEVRDNDPPNLFLAIKDTRTGVTHIYGDNTQTLDSGTSPWTGYSTTTDNSHCRSETIAGFEYSAGESADQSGYGAFQGTYGGQTYVFHNHADNTDGLWIDEDTKLVFSSWGFDNINTYNSSHGLADASRSGSEAHCWWGENMDFVNFTVTDTPGNNSGKWFPEYIFRYPNRPSSLNTGDCSVEVTCSDGRGVPPGTRRVKVNVWVIWNKKEIRSLEEFKYRIHPTP